MYLEQLGIGKRVDKIKFFTQYYTDSYSDALRLESRPKNTGPNGTIAEAL